MTSRDRLLRLVTWIVIASEALMFAVLFAAHGGIGVEPPPLALLAIAVVTGALIASCCALASAVRHARGARPELVERRLVLAIFLGAGAVVIELAAAMMFTAAAPLGLVIAGLHAAHVAGAIALAGWVTALCRGQIRRSRALGIELVAIYWYFVTVLWFFVAVLVGG